MQLGVMICLFMALVSYIRFVHVARVEREAVMRANGGELPDLLPPAPTAQMPVAKVARKPSHEHVTAPSPPPDTRECQGESGHGEWVSGRGEGVSGGGEGKSRGGEYVYAAPISDNVTKWQADDAPEVNSNPVFEEMHATHVSIAAAERRVAEDFVQEKEGNIDECKIGMGWSGVDVEESALAAAMSLHKSKGGFIGFTVKVLDSVRPDPAIGFRCPSCHNVCPVPQ
jgi:hypothetical protein